MLSIFPILMVVSFLNLYLKYCERQPLDYVIISFRVICDANFNSWKSSSDFVSVTLLCGSKTFLKYVLGYLISGTDLYDYVTPVHDIRRCMILAGTYTLHSRVKCVGRPESGIAYNQEFRYFVTNFSPWMASRWHESIDSTRLFKNMTRDFRLIFNFCSSRWWWEKLL